MSKLNLTNLANLQNENTAVAAINANNTAIENAIENTLSRDGTTPNQMSSNLDMNSNRIINLPEALEGTEPVRLFEFNELVMPAVVPVTIPVSITSGGTGATTALQARSNLGLRDIWTGPRTYYVRTDGSDSNTGLVNNAGGAFLTIQKAINVIYAGDTQGYTPTIQVSDGTYTGDTIVSGPLFGAVSSFIFIIGNIAVPTNVVINAATPFAANLGARLDISGFKIQGSGNGFSCNSWSDMHLSAINWGALTGFGVVSSSYSHVSVTGGITISGSMGGFCHITDNSFFQSDASLWTITGVPAFAAFFAGTSENSLMKFFNTFSGTATGKRAFIHQGSIVETSGNTPSHPDSYFPGNVASTFNSDGSFNDNTGLTFVTTQSTLVGASGASDLINVYGYSPLKTVVTQDNTGMLSAPFPLGGKTVAQLPAASATIKGLRDVVSDCTTQVFMQTAIGGGGLVAPVTCIGSSWVVA